MNRNVFLQKKRGETRIKALTHSLKVVLFPSPLASWLNEEWNIKKKICMRINEPSLYEWRPSEPRCLAFDHFWPFINHFSPFAPLKFQRLITFLDVTENVSCFKISLKHKSRQHLTWFAQLAPGKGCEWDKFEYWLRLFNPPRDLLVCQSFSQI